MASLIIIFSKRESKLLGLLEPRLHLDIIYFVEVNIDKSQS